MHHKYWYLQFKSIDCVVYKFGVMIANHQLQSAALNMFQGLALRHFISGVIAVLVGFTSSVAIIFQAANAAGATPSQVTSWMLVLGVGIDRGLVLRRVAGRYPL
jgi:predicted benzoate:H+ symporter BenE